MKILHVLDHSLPLQSAYTLRTSAIVREQQRRGWTTCHLTSTKQEAVGLNTETIEGWPFYRTRSRSMFNRFPVLTQYGEIRDLRQRLSEVVAIEKPDIVHCHSPCLTGLAALPVCRAQQLPLVYEMRATWEDTQVSLGMTSEGNLRYRVSRALETHLLRHADAITTICAGLVDDISARGIDKNSITVVPNAVDAEHFDFRKLHDERLGDDLALSGKAVIGFIGSFDAYEGIDLLVRALPGVRTEISNAHLLLVGSGPEDGRLRALVTSLKLDRHVTFTGRVPHAEVPAYYSVIDMMTYPRRAIRLTDIVTPLKPLEAMAMGTVLVASNIGGHRELILDGQTGTLFKADSIEALRKCLIATWQNRAEWPSQLRVARDFVVRERTWSASVSNYEAVYNRLLR